MLARQTNYSVSSIRSNLYDETISNLMCAELPELTIPFRGSDTCFSGIEREGERTRDSYETYLTIDCAVNAYVQQTKQISSVILYYDDSPFASMPKF